MKKSKDNLTQTSTRVAQVQRKTKETNVRLKLNLDGAGRSRIDTGLPFLDHMIELFAKHGLFDLNVACKGDLEVDDHHSVEDVALALGQALTQALGDKVGIQRYGDAMVPMRLAFPRGGYAVLSRRSTATPYCDDRRRDVARRKAVGFPHIGRQSRNTLGYFAYDPGWHH